MLVLSRKKGEMIQIGNDIVLRITQIDQNHVKIGISAPGSVRVMRAELCPESPAIVGLAALLEQRKAVRRMQGPHPVPGERVPAQAHS